MNEDLVELMNSNWARIDRGLAKGMKVDSKKKKPKLEDFIEIDTLKDGALQRVKESSWEPSTIDETDKLVLRQFKPALERAYELVFEETLDINELRHSPGGVERRCCYFGTLIRKLEREVALQLVCEKANCVHGYDERTLKVQAQNMHHLCRLLVPNPEGDLEKKARTQGWVDEVIKLATSRTENVRALLVRNGGGPVFQRIVDDLAATWQRTDSGEEVKLVVSERFFVEVPDGSAVKFQNS